MTRHQQLYRRVSAESFHAASLVVMGAFLLLAPSQPRVHAITIDMEYTDEGDPVPHDENPGWDPDGTILKAHFQAAKAIWEALLLGEGEEDYSFDFHWDDDIDDPDEPGTTLGLTTQSGLDVFVEINPLANWFADPTPTMDEEFSTTGTQKIFSQLSAADKSTFFPGTPPPDALETRFLRSGNSAVPGAGGFGSQNGFDLLTVIVHEMGHVLGIAGNEPGEFNIMPMHVGGLSNVLVLEDNDGGHLAGDDVTPGFLMCDGCATPGGRYYPTATDILVIAEDQGIADVNLARIGRISSGAWSDVNAWIGGDVPDLTKDVYIPNAGAVVLDTDAQTRDLVVTIGNSIAVQNHQLTSNGTFTFTGAPVSMGAGGTIEANNIIGDPVTLTTAAGSLVRFSQFTRSAISSTTSASFAGSLAIGYDTGSPNPTTFAPSVITAWSVAENLTIGDESDAALVVNGTTWNVTGNVTVGSGPGMLTIKNSGATNGAMTVGGNVDVRGSSAGFSELLVERVGTTTGDAVLNVTGHIIARQNGKVRFKDASPPSTTYDIHGGATEVGGGILSTPFEYEHTPGGSLTFEGSIPVSTVTINVDGGAGVDAAGGLVTFKGSTHALDVTFQLNAGRPGDYSPYLCCLEEAGNGGQVRFEDSGNAGNATFNNHGVAEFRGGTGGLTVFADNSSAHIATIHNHGATFNKGGGGATHFLNSSTAGDATITNHADGTFVYSSMSGHTVFFDSSNAGTAEIENASGANAFNPPGRTEFRNSSSAAGAIIHNQGNPNLGGGSAGVTEFYDTASAADATINLYEGYHDSGRTDFYNQSTAANAQIFVVATNPPGGSSHGGGGNLVFHDNSTAADSHITLQAQACCNGVQFKDNATAASAEIVQEDGSGRITFTETSTAGDADFSVGQDSGIEFFHQSNAGTATITMANRARVQFTNSSSAGQSQIEIAGASASGPIHLGGLDFNLNSTAGDATIVAHGGTAAGAVGARVSFINGAHAGNATITAHGGTGGGTGATVGFSSGATGDTARLIANAGATVDFGDQRTFGGTQVGSIEGAGTVVLNGSQLTTGNRNTSTTVSGSIVNGFLPGGMLTKVGDGTLTLAGANTYSGLTTVNDGTLSVTGSVAGSAVVNSGGTLNGTGSIGGTVTVNAGGVFAPGTSPGTITLHGLTMTPNGTLDFEIGSSARDRILLTSNGNVALDGILNVTLLGGFTPTLGQSFSVLGGSIGSVTGFFDSLVAPTFNGLTFDVLQTSGSLRLKVVQPGSGGSSNVPEPDGWQLVLAVGLLLLAFCRAWESSQNVLRRPRITTWRALPCVAR